MYVFCLANVQTLKKSKNSLLWSLDKKRWIYGPTIPSKYAFVNSCAAALNSTSVLFVGISDIETSEITQSVVEDTPNDIVALFDFETMKWIEQDYVTFPTISDFDSIPRLAILAALTALSSIQKCNKVT